MNSRIPLRCGAVAEPGRQNSRNRKMIFRFTAYLLLLLFGGACAGDGYPYSGEEEGETATDMVRLNVIFVTSQAGASRSPGNGTGGTDGQLGTAGESKVATALVVLGALPKGAAAPDEVHSVHDISEFERLSDDKWTGEISAEPGSYRLLVVVNPTEQITAALRDAAGLPWNDMLLKAYRAEEYTELSQIWKDGSFLMTNAYQNDVAESDAELVAGKDKEVMVHVQRACARFDFQPTKDGNAYGIDASIDGKTVRLSVTLQKARLVNASRGFHLFKQICSDDTGINPTVYAHESGNNYVYDTDWNEKKRVIGEENISEAAGLFFLSSEVSGTDGYRPLPTDKGNYSFMFYCPENTIPGIARQVNCLSTGIVFGGGFTVPSSDASKLYYIEKKGQLFFYTSLDKLKEAHSLELSGTDDAALAKAGIRHFKKGEDGTFPVWYTYWNRHNDNGDPTRMGVMEFAVVRNNVYKLQVNSISSFGLPEDPGSEGNPWKPSWNTPDELGPQLDVTVTVAGWTDRTYDTDI